MSAIVLAYSGGFRSSVALRWLADTGHTDIVTVTLDTGQGEDLGAIRGRALSLGAIRAHAIDAREDLAREYLLPSMHVGAFGDGRYPSIDQVAWPLVARTLVEVAAIEGARSVAHAALDTALDDAIRAAQPSMEVLAVARLWPMDPAQLIEYARTHGVAGPRGSGTCRVEQNLWGRVVSWPDGNGSPVVAPPPALPRSPVPPDEAAEVEIRFERGIPVSVNAVPMSPVEIVEILTLIAGRHGVGRFETSGEGRRVVYDAPAAVVLHAAHAASGGSAAVVRLSLGNGQYTVLDSRP
jgi:argininosuccinate synthase